MRNATLSLIGYALLGVMIVGLGAYWIATSPGRSDAMTLAGIKADVAAGEQVFWASGCATCHVTGGDSTLEASLQLGGGRALTTEFGTFYVPNISSDVQNGIGGWTLAEFAAAVRQGVSPEGTHYYPAFPYAAYNKMSDADLVSLWAFVQTLPPVATPSRAQQVDFPYNIRRNLGVWKLLFVRQDWAVTGALSPQQQRGRYLVEALGHCGECHTPRNALGGPERAQWLAGAPNPNGKGSIPNITPAKLDWSEADIAAYLSSGFTPDYDTAGGEMASVVENIAHLGDDDRLAIAAYLKAVPPVE